MRLQIPLIFDAHSPFVDSQGVQDKVRYYRASGKKSSQKWRNIVLIFIIVFASALVLQIALRQLIFYPLKITTNSMEPKILTNDKKYFIYPRLSAVKKDDVVLLRMQNADAELLCRVVAVDGDKVQIERGELFVNGGAVRRLIPRFEGSEDKNFHLSELEVRPNFIFCLNDNAANTNDSRVHGIFSRGQIIGKLINPIFFF